MISLIKNGLALVIAALCLCQVAASPAFQEAQDEVRLIKGLMRDELFEVAADKIFDFVFKYPGHNESEQLLFDICQALENKGNFSKAVPLLRCYLQEFPQGQLRRPVSLLLARALMELGEYPEASTLLRDIIPDSVYSTADRLDAKEMLASIYYSQDRYEEARALLEDTNPKGTGPGIRLVLAKSLRGLQQFQGAEEVLKGLIARRRRDEIWFSARDELVKLYLQQARYQECIQFLSDWKPPDGEDYSDRDEALALALAVSYYHLGDYQTAFQTIEPIWLKEKDSGETSAHLPGTLLALKEWSAAAQVLENSFSATQDTLERIKIGTELSEALLKAGMDSRLTGVLETLATLTNDPLEQSGYYLQAADVSKSVQEKIGFLDKAIGSGIPARFEAELHFEKGQLLLKSGDIQASIEEFKKTRSSADPGAYAGRAAIEQGKTYLMQGDYARACERFIAGMAAGSLATDKQTALQLLIRCRYFNRQWRAASDRLDEYVNSQDKQAIDASVWKMAAFADARAGKSGRAVIEALWAVMNDAGENTDESARLLLFAAVQSASEDSDLEESIYQNLLGSDDQAVRQRGMAGLVVLAIKKNDWQTVLDRSHELSQGSDDAWIKGWADLISAQALGKLNRVQEQTAALQQIVTGSRDNPFSKAAVEELQNIDLAGDKFGEALQADPEFMLNSPASIVAADQMLVNALKDYLSGNFSRAAQRYASYPDNEHLQMPHKYFYARSLFETGDYSHAIKLLKGIDPAGLQIPWQWQRERMIAEILLKEGEAKEAHEYFSHLLEMPLTQEERFAILLSAAQAADASDQWSVASALYKEYLDKTKVFEPQLESLEIVAKAFIAHDDSKTAIDVYRLMELLAGGQEKSIVYSFKIAELKEKVEEPEVAAEEYLRIAYRNPDLGVWPARARLRAAAIYEKLNRIETAERQYRLVAENYPGTEEGISAARSLREIIRRREQIQEEQIREPRQ